MTKYEATGETTDDPAVAVGWGVWRSSAGNLYRVVANGFEPIIEYQGLDGWGTAGGLGQRPHERMRVVVEPRSGAELRRWLVAHPGVAVTYAQEGTLGLVLWDPGRAEYRGAAYEGCSCSVFCGPWKHDMKPADGGGWDR